MISVIQSKSTNIEKYLKMIFNIHFMINSYLRRHVKR